MLRIETLIRRIGYGSIGKPSGYNQNKILQGSNKNSVPEMRIFHDRIGQAQGG